MKRDHQNRNLREKFTNLLGDIYAIQVRHLIVQQNQIRRRLEHLVQSLGTSSRFAAHLPRGLLLKNGSQIMAYRRIVIDQQNANHANTSQPGGSRSELPSSDTTVFA